jgi:uncharacterized membrane protein
VVDQINERLKRFGDLSSDGRPILDCTAPQLVEEVMAVSEDNMVFPAHAWTPWFSLFGAFSGFNTVEDCYQDMTKHIHALETGLSSDPPMNWRLSKLDRYSLLSNSDCHSFWPWRIGREANVFDLPDLTYNFVTSAIIDNDPERFKYTIETDPAYGKYHWTGHRNCKVSLAPSDQHPETEVVVDRNVIILALASGVFFGLFYIAFSRVSEDAGLWPVTIERAAGSIVLVALALALTRGPFVGARRLLPYVLVIAVLEVAAVVPLLLALQRGPVAIATVLASLYPVTTVLLAGLVLRERLSRLQYVGVACALASVALVSTG